MLHRQVKPGLLLEKGLCAHRMRNVFSYAAVAALILLLIIILPCIVSCLPQPGALGP